MNAVNYDKIMQEEMKSSAGKKLLLHSCCAPCSSYCLQELHKAFQVTVLFYNPNLDSEEEYHHRKTEQIRFLKETGWADLLDCDYAAEEFKKCVKGKEKCKEGGARCYECYKLRLERTAKTAATQGYDLFATTLTISPLKNAVWLNEIGEEMAQKYGVKYLPTDFKKRNGYLQSVSLSKEYNLYRQDYCGCIYSKAERIPHSGNEDQEDL